ncbi:UNVERIFIED_CONTAM: hypothetical protein FKN15_045732 [Acipenser sinensis]
MTVDVEPAGIHPLLVEVGGASSPPTAAEAEPAGIHPLLVEVGGASSPPTAAEAEPAGIHPLLVEVGGASSPPTAAEAEPAGIHSLLVEVAEAEATPAALPLAVVETEVAPAALLLAVVETEAEAALAALLLVVEAEAAGILPLLLEAWALDARAHGSSPSGAGNNGEGSSPSGVGDGSDGSSPSGAGDDNNGSSPSGAGDGSNGSSPSCSGDGSNGSSPSGAGDGSSWAFPDGAGDSGSPAISAARRLITSGRASSAFLPGSTSQPQIPSEESELVGLLASGTSPPDAGRSGSSISCRAWLWLSGKYLTSRSPSLAHRRLITSGRASSAFLPGSTSQPQIPSEESELVGLLASGTSPPDAGRSGSSISCRAWLWLSGKYLTSPHRKHHPSSSRQARQTSGVVEMRRDL